MAVSKAELDRRMKRLAETFCRLGMKVTHQRVEVFREAAGTDEHPDAETIYQRVRGRVNGISRDTVYRTLATLEQAGIILRTEAAGGSARFDANLERHHHFACTICGAVKDFRSSAMDDLPIPAAARALGRVESAQMHLRGVCAACSRRGAGRRKA